MNGFSAADMSTAAANGHRDGYQAGYADAVKAFEAAQPAAAQESVAIHQFRHHDSSDWYDVTPEDHPHVFNDPDFIVRTVYAAPVAEAPVVDVATLRALADRWANDRSYTGSPVDDIRALIEQPTASTPAAPVDDDWHLRGYAYASKQATTCAGCNKHKHTPLRIDAMGGYVCLTCIDQKLGSLLGEFGSTPAAPGIDLDALRDIANDLSHSAKVDDYETQQIEFIESIRDRLLTVIDVSPKGGHCTTCTCDPNMTPAIRFDLSPAMVEGEVRNHLIALGWTPPDGPKGGVNGRATFQRWAVSQNLSTQRSELHIGMGGDYVDRATSRAWEAWQAAMQATSAEVGA